MDRFELVLVRHGKTEWNDGARFQGHLDSALTPSGVKEVECLGTRLRTEPIAAVYSSDLGRAVHTATIIAKRIGMSVSTDPRLRERALGIFQGLRKEDVEVKYPDAWQKYASHDPDYVVPNGESARGRFDVGYSCIMELARRHRGQRIVVVTHGGVVQGMFRHVSGVSFAAPRRFSIRNATYNLLSLQGESWEIETWGDTSHFGCAVHDPMQSKPAASEPFVA